MELMGKRLERSRDDRTIEGLVRRYGPALRACFERRVGDRAEAEELAPFIVSKRSTAIVARPTPRIVTI